MAYRIFNVKVLKVDADNNKLIIQRKKADIGKTENLKTAFKVDPHAIITNRSGSFLKISDIKPGDRINIDFIKTRDIREAKDKSLLAKGINIMDD